MHLCLNKKRLSLSIVSFLNETTQRERPHIIFNNFDMNVLNSKQSYDVQRTILTPIESSPYL